MSEAEEKNDKRPGEEEDLPTASFSGSAPVVAHRTSGSMR